MVVTATPRIRYCCEMVLYRVYGEPQLRDYYTTVCSRATLFLVVIYCLVLVPPVLIAYATNDFWRTVVSYREQPNVHYTNQTILLLGGEGGGAAWSSLPNYTPPPDIEPLPDPLNITISEEDTNGDRKSEALMFVLDFPPPTINVTSVHLLLFFRVQLSSYSSVEIDSVAYVSQLSGGSLLASPSGLWVGGVLGLHQSRPLPASGRGYSYDSLLNTSSGLWEDYRVDSILSNYYQRELTAVLHPVYPVWQYNSSGGGGFRLQADIQFTEQTLLYRPGFWERLKWAWVQYLPIALLFWFSLSQVKSFVFQNHIVPTIKPYSH